MSRTDKDRPYWVQAIDDGTINHNHDGGYCRVETLNEAKHRGNKYPQYRRGSRHVWRCNKRTTEYYECTKLEPEQWGYFYLQKWYAVHSIRCWSWHPANFTPGFNGVLDKAPTSAPHRHQCAGHRRRVFDDSISCICDDDVDLPSCFRELDDPYRRWFPSPDRDFRRDVWNSPERRRERDDLNDLAREYNAYGDIEDDDFPNPHHRHQSWWLYY